MINQDWTKCIKKLKNWIDKYDYMLLGFACLGITLLSLYSLFYILPRYLEGNQRSLQTQVDYNTFPLVLPEVDTSLTGYVSLELIPEDGVVELEDIDMSEFLEYEDIDI